MLDLQYICDHSEEIIENCRRRGVQANIPRIVELRAKRGELIAKGDHLRHESKESAARIPQCKDPVDRQTLIARGRELKELVAANEADVRTLEGELKEELIRVPNLSHPEAPVGATENDSKTVRTWGKIPEFSFKPLDHVELAAKNDVIDFEAGSRVTGHGFYFLKNEGALLELALINYAVETLRRHGFTIYTTPDLARDEVLEGIGFSPRGPETQIYSIHETDLSLVATAEITLGGIYRDHILEHAQLPIKAAGISHCFRTEAGGHGKATRGIYRVHQFTKVEMFAFTAGDTQESDRIHAEIVGIEEEIYQGLGVPYRVLDTCTGDLGGPAYRKFDLEAWMPGRNEYGEVTSASNCTDYQSRRLAIRYRHPEQKGTQFVHTLNGTAIAVSRAIVSIFENYQQPDGSILIPEVLKKWMMGVERISPR